ncbi:MAG TPA: ABC transporter ATP-binding protein [Gemmatimonadales bacterium]|jgi:energy-coupling factor transporter ATP-binding protein EcfA2
MTLIASDLWFRYPVQQDWALRGVDLSITPGEVTWFTGALGSGTSTMLLALAGLAPRLTGGERRGAVTLDGRDISDGSVLGRGIGYLGASPMLQLSGITNSVRDEVAVGPMNLGWPAARIAEAVVDAMARLDISHLAARAPGKLSGGETQRLLLAALLASAPSTWLLDEPFAALDRGSAARVGAMLRQLADAGHRVVVACDDADQMLGLADRILVFNSGSPVLDDLPDRILAGDQILVARAGTSDAATLAFMAGFAAPRPVRREDLLRQVELDPAATPHETESSSSGAPALDFANVGFSYRSEEPVLSDLTFSIAKGEAVGLFGANGAGKSTALRLAMALEYPVRGVVTTLGRPTAGRFPEHFAPQVGYLFQQPERQLFASSVTQECLLAPTVAGWNGDRAATAVAGVLEELGLADTAKEHPYDLPLPRRRLVALAAILAADPELLLLDEPTAGLDAVSRDLVIGAVRRRVEGGRAVLAITHDPLFAHEALDRGLLLDQCRLVLDGPVRDVIDDRRLRQPAALVIAIALGLPPGADRRNEVARLIERS